MGISVYSILLLVAVIFTTLVGIDFWRRRNTQPVNRKTKPRYTPKPTVKPAQAKPIDTGPDPLFDTIEPVEPIFETTIHEEVTTIAIERKKEEITQPVIEAAQPVAEPTSPPVLDPIYAVIHVMAREGARFDGPNVLQALLSMGLKHGKMSIFHRHEEAQGRGAVQFSVASAVEPGIFDLDTMGSFSTPGLTLFMSVPGPKAPLAAYDLMIETADKLADRLDGEVQDAQHQPLSTEVIEHKRALIGDRARQLDAKQA